MGFGFKSMRTVHRCAPPFIDCGFSNISCYAAWTPPPPVGHQVIVVWCNCCGHKANVAPELWHRTTKRHFRMCGSRDYTHRIIWVRGPRPDNLVPFAK